MENIFFLSVFDDSFDRHKNRIESYYIKKEAWTNGGGQ